VKSSTAEKRLLVGAWRIVDMELWSADDLDLLGPAHLTLERNGLGTLGFLAIEAGLDYRIVEREGLPAVEFSFEGSDEGDRISGRGWAVLDADQLRGRLFLHNGDDSAFTAGRSQGGRPDRRPGGDAGAGPEPQSRFRCGRN
jgi:hypothetical protein